MAAIGIVLGLTAAIVYGGSDFLGGAASKRVSDVALPQGSLIISVLRDGRGFVPTADTVVEAGDQVLLVLDSGLEDQITPVFAPD